jgi:hypothetical protein
MSQMEQVTTITAGAAVATSWWHPVIENVSVEAATWLPVLGVMWLVIQIWGRLSPLIKKRWKSWKK